ncbi:21.7 kDa class VI heat shock protein [Abeliophyllum distichum]|uniref:21.7 kDa class VI heat shock protein n=1 Tax=Abeliophyllum distichum TaxID=126358 RepID=A0ABD1QJ37_9LAMI
MTSCRQLEIQFEDQNPQKWCHPLKEEAFAAFMRKENPTVHKVFDERSLFSPLLFGKFFDPSDAFPLWEFESDVLLSNLHSSGQRSVDWSQTDADYVLKAELPGIGLGNNTIQVCIEGGKVLEISGQWRQHKDPKKQDWRSSHWWEHGYVRRLELPENSDWRKLEANVKNDVLLEIRIPKTYLDGDKPQAS